VNVTDLNPYLGTEYTGLTYDDLRSPQLLDQIMDSVHRRDLAVIRSIELTPDQQIALARRVGRPVPFVLSDWRHPDHEEIMVSSNETRDGRPIGIPRVGSFWHQDSSYLKDPAPYTMLHGVNVPGTSGHTRFASAADVYDRLPGRWKARLAGLTGSHTLTKQQRIGPEHVGLSIAEMKAQVAAEYPAVHHPVVRHDPHTGRLFLYGCREYMEGVAGLDPNDTEAFFDLVDSLVEEAGHVYTHRWTGNDLLIWKTMTTYHVATPVAPGVSRTVHRISIEAA